MVTHSEMAQADHIIQSADAEQLAELLIAGLTALGQYGRQCAEPMLAQIRRDGAEESVEEGLSWMTSLEGVLDGRTDAL